MDHLLFSGSATPVKTREELKKDGKKLEECLTRTALHKLWHQP